MTRHLTRRALLNAAGLGAAALVIPRVSYAQGAPLRLGVLTPLTGAGGNDGPRMLKAMQVVATEVNDAGGVMGRKIELVIEDDQTNPEAAVRAARKLIDVEKVPVIMGTWASAVTSAVAPVCWESKTFLTTVSGADSITLLPHQGYLIRTQPNNHLQAAKHAEFIGQSGAKRVFILSIQAPFSVPTQKRLEEVLPQYASALVGAWSTVRESAAAPWASSTAGSKRLAAASARPSESLRSTSATRAAWAPALGGRTSAASASTSAHSLSAGSA